MEQYKSFVNNNNRQTIHKSANKKRLLEKPAQVTYSRRIKFFWFNFVVISIAKEIQKNKFSTKLAVKYMLILHITVND